MSDVLVYFALEYEGSFPEIYHALQRKEEVDPDQYFELKKDVHHKHFTLIDNVYPNQFKEISCPPVVLFYQGNKELLSKDLPMKELYLDDHTRAYSSIEPIMQDGKIIFDYVIAAENHDNVDKLYDHIKDKGLPLKDYTKQKIMEEKVC